MKPWTIKLSAEWLMPSCGGMDEVWGQGSPVRHHRTEEVKDSCCQTMGERSLSKNKAMKLIALQRADLGTGRPHSLR